jgi:hypothetical protein
LWRASNENLDLCGCAAVHCAFGGLFQIEVLQFSLAIFTGSDLLLEGAASLRLGLHLQPLGTYTSDEPKRHGWRARAILIFGIELRDDPFRRGHDAEFAKAYVVGHRPGVRPSP